MLGITADRGIKQETPPPALHRHGLQARHDIPCNALPAVERMREQFLHDATERACLREWRPERDDARDLEIRGGVVTRDSGPGAAFIFPRR